MHTEAMERAVTTVEEAVDACRRQAMSASQYGCTAVDALLVYLDDEAAAPSEATERDTAVFRGVLFQIKDAHRLREVVAA